MLDGNKMTRLLPALLLAFVAVTPLSASAQDKKAEMKAEPASTMKAEAKKDEPTKAAKAAAAKKDDEKKKPKRGSC